MRVRVCSGRVALQAARVLSVTPTRACMRCGERLWVGVRACRLRPMTMDDTLCAAADKYCQEMAEKGYVGHISPDGRSPFYR